MLEGCKACTSNCASLCLLCDKATVVGVCSCVCLCVSVCLRVRKQ